ncbi:unnamed protein product [Meganyctiphanes norvegica]|uniref:Peptidase S1 domain-containing protein n=1 Tax=Meganyctiphanes norvegica TaxID=48144 RepID=A0AAV2PRM9_MEGNR
MLLLMMIFSLVMASSLQSLYNDSEPWSDPSVSSVQDSFEIREQPLAIMSVASRGVSALYRLSRHLILLIFNILFTCIGWLFFGEVRDDRPPISMPEICGRGPDARIIGGEVAPAAPWIVSLKLWKRHTCGGALITARHVLTAAHCVLSWKKVPGLLKIGLGSNILTNQTVIDVSKVAVCQNFTKNKESKLEGDIAILTLSKDVDFNLQVEPICLPESPPDIAADAVVMGWGRTHENKTNSRDPNVLQAVSIPVLSPTICSLAYDKIFTDNMICAGDVSGGKDSCQGDSGGPLIIRNNTMYTQIGVVSFGKGCGRPGYPGVYTNIVNYMQWIRDELSS